MAPRRLTQIPLPSTREEQNKTLARDGRGLGEGKILPRNLLEVTIT